jgi:hypothetical protein
MSKSDLRGLKSDPTDDSTEPRITRHVEPRDLGGEAYHRCTGCGRESVHGASNIVHRDGCQHA